jgi:hypothetical protein
VVKLLLTNKSLPAVNKALSNPAHIFPGFPVKELTKTMRQRTELKNEILYNSNCREGILMKKTMFLLLLFMILVIIQTGCDKDATGLAEGQSRLNIYLTDATAIYDSVNITFSEVSVHLDSSWITVKRDPVTVDLLEWSNGRKLLIGSADVPPGLYTQVRIIIEEAVIGVGGEVFPLTVPSGAQTGLKFGPEFLLEDGSTYELVIDFDAERSIVTTGPPNNPKSYKLKPHIRVTTTAASGSISGMVSNPENLPLACAILEGDTVTTSFVDKNTGHFMLGFLPPSNYLVTVTDTLLQTFEQVDVPVVAGDDYDLGTITLE